ncbi:MAG: hypothetical protein HY394_06460 [Candidatus Diapherotrites archaeon]|nr:hypothetical protein [Candidatus Diapherotrites archaeon]
MPRHSAREMERRTGWEFKRDGFNLRQEADKETHRTGALHYARGRALEAYTIYKRAFGVPEMIPDRQKDFIGIVESRDGKRKTYWYIDRRGQNSE